MSTRDRILDAAAHVMRERGLVRSTTKEIARHAGYSEAALYKHFQDKTGLFLAVLSERAPSNLMPLLGELSPDEGDPQRNLIRVARAAIVFYQHSFPIAASLFSDPHLFAAHREALSARGAGPHHVVEALSGYLAAEQRAGRIRDTTDPTTAAGLLLGACMQYAFLGHFTGHPDEPAIDHHAATLVEILLTGPTPDNLGSGL